MAILLTTNAPSTTLGGDGRGEVVPDTLEDASPMAAKKPSQPDPKVPPPTPESMPSARHGAAMTMESMSRDVEVRTAELAAELRLDSGFGLMILRHAASCSLRMERTAVGIRALKSRWLRHAGVSNGPNRRSEADRMFAALYTEPAATRHLRATPEGIALMHAAWGGLHAVLADPEFPRWTADHLKLAEGLLGHLPGDGRITDFRRYTEVYDHHPSPLVAAAELRGRSPAQRQDYARAKLAGFVAAEMTTLAAEYTPLATAAAIEAQREAAELARFEDSPEARRAARMMLEDERMFARGLRSAAMAAKLAQEAAERMQGPGAKKPRRAESMKKAIDRVLAEHRARINRIG